MNLDAFVAQRTASWQALERGLKGARGRPERLGAAGALELGRAYRAAVADLAFARRRYPGDPVVDRLERLVLAGRQAVYGKRVSHGSVLGFFSRGYWRLVLGRPGVLAASAAALLCPCVLAGVWAVHDPAAAIGLLPSRLRSAGDPHLRHLAVGAATQAVLASSIFTNNIQVTFLAFAGGLTLGAGTLVVLAYNGLMLGALGGITLQTGQFSMFVRYVAPHAMLELSCIAVGGAAGLRLAWAMIDPGTQPRGESLRRQARPAVAVVLGTAPWLVAAGLTEGFVTPEGLPLAAALAVGIGLAGAFWLLAATRGRGAATTAGALTGAPGRGAAMTAGALTGAPGPSP